MILEKLPPGHEATNIIPKASSGSIFKAQVKRQVASGSNKNCANKPAKGATGYSKIRLKSSNRKLNDTPNIIKAKIALSVIKLAGLKIIGNAPLMMKYPLAAVFA